MGTGLIGILEAAGVLQPSAKGAAAAVSLPPAGSCGCASMARGGGESRRQQAA